MHVDEKIFFSIRTSENEKIFFKVLVKYFCSLFDLESVNFKIIVFKNKNKQCAIIPVANDFLIQFQCTFNVIVAITFWVSFFKPKIQMSGFAIFGIYT